MHRDSWPRRARPATTGPPYEAEITDARQLRTVRSRLRSWLPATAPGADEDLLDGLLLAVDELAANGLRHGGGPVRVHAARTAGGVLVDVSDGDPERGPEPAVGRDPALGGMGLHVVAHLTTARGWEVCGDRKHVWACLPTG